MNQLSFATLGKIALGGLFIIPVTGFGVRWLMQEQIKKTAPYCEVMECIRSQKQIKELLGEPIVDGRIDVGDNNCFGRDSNTRWITIPLKGTKATGCAKYWVVNNDDKEQISKIHFQVEQAGEKIELIKDMTINVTNVKK